jgi:hypothetical protein
MIPISTPREFGNDAMVLMHILATMGENEVGSDFILYLLKILLDRPVECWKKRIPVVPKSNLLLTG